jgi:hypothetical protein
MCMSLLAMRRPNHQRCWTRSTSSAMSRLAAARRLARRGQSVEPTPSSAASSVERLNSGLRPNRPLRSKRSTSRKVRPACTTMRVRGALDPRQGHGAVQGKVLADQQIGPAPYRGRAIGAGELHQHVRCVASVQLAQRGELRELARGTRAWHAGDNGPLGQACIGLTQPARLQGPLAPPCCLAIARRPGCRDQTAADVRTGSAQHVDDAFVGPIHWIRRDRPLPMLDASERAAQSK